MIVCSDTSFSMGDLIIDLKQQCIEYLTFREILTRIVLISKEYNRFWSNWETCQKAFDVICKTLMWKYPLEGIMRRAYMSKYNPKTASANSCCFFQNEFFFKSLPWFENFLFLRIQYVLNERNDSPFIQWVWLDVMRRKVLSLMPCLSSSKPLKNVKINNVSAFFQKYSYNETIYIHSHLQWHQTLPKQQKSFYETHFLREYCTKGFSDFRTFFDPQIDFLSVFSFHIKRGPTACLYVVGTKNS